MFKLINRRKKKGQSTLEYAILVIIVIVALLTVQTYVKRGLQGRLKQAADDIGDQFSPGNYNYSMNSFTNSRTNEAFNAGVGSSTLLADEITSTNTFGGIINVEQEFYDRDVDIKRTSK